MLNENTLLIVLRFFRLFGFVPYRIAANKRLTRQTFYVVFIPFILFVYWLALIESFWNVDEASDKLSIISNWIQLLVNGFSLTIILMIPLTMERTINSIHKNMTNFDTRIRAMGLTINNKKINAIVLANVTFYMAFFCYMMVYEIYVVLMRYKLLGFIYWIITFLPFIVYSVALSFACCLLIFIHYRLDVTRDILKKELKSDQKLAINGSRIYQSVKPKMIYKTLDCVIPAVFHLFNDLLDLCHAFEQFFGPIFLCCFTSIFVVTTIQIYYCYVLIATPFNDNKGYSIWSAVLCINVIILNSITTVLLTSVCEKIANQVSF